MCEFAREPQPYYFIIFTCGLIVFLILDVLFFCYNTCSRKISGVCLGFWFVSKKIEARLHLFNLLGNFHFGENGIHIWHVEIFLV